MTARSCLSIPYLALAAFACSGGELLAQSPTVLRASVSSAGAESNAATPLRSNALSVSADGRFVAFISTASNLVPGDTNGIDDAFVRDLVAGTTERVSISTAGQQMLADRSGRGCLDVAVSGDGRYVVFSTAGVKLIDGEKSSGSRIDVYVRDRSSSTTERVSLSTSGGAPSADSACASISADGRYVAFYSYATNLVLNDRNRTSDVFVRDRVSRTTLRASVSASGAEANGSSLCTTTAALSADGRKVMFISVASNLVASDTNALADIFVRDLDAGTIERVNRTPSGAQSLGGVQLGTQSISGDGRFVMYVSNAADLLPPGAPVTTPGATPPNYCYQAFQFDRATSTTSIVSRGWNGELADRGVGSGIATSSDGSRVLFVSSSTNLVPGFGSTSSGVFLRDGATGALQLASQGLGGSFPNGASWALQVALDAAGATAVFGSEASNLVINDTNALRDVFVARW